MKQQITKILDRIKQNENFPVFLMALAYTIFFGTVACLRHYNFRSFAWDLGIYEEVIWNTARGGRFAWSAIHNVNYFGHHFNPISYLFVPFYYIGANTYFLLIVQTISIAVGAFPIYWLAKDNLNNKRFHTLFPLAYLLSLPLWHINLYDYHPEALAMSLLIFSFYFLSKDKYLFSSIFLLFAMVCKENMLIVGSFMGLYALLAKKNKLYGLFFLVLGATSFILVIEYLIPTVSGAKYVFFKTYSYMGNGLSEYLSTMLFHPIFVLKHIFVGYKITWFILLYASVAFLPFFAPLVFILNLPVLLENLLSAQPTMCGFHSPYNDGLIPFVFIAAIFGLKNILNSNWRHKDKALVYARRIMILFVVVSLLELFLGFFIRYVVITPRTASLNKAVNSIPASASVCASNTIYPHMIYRKKIFMFPNNYQDVNYHDVDYILINELDPTWPINDADYPAKIKELFKNGKFRTLLEFIFLGEPSKENFMEKKEYLIWFNKVVHDKHFEIVERKDLFVLLKRKK